MLEKAISLISILITISISFFIVKKILDPKIKVSSVKNIILLIILVLFFHLIYNKTLEFDIIYTISGFLFMMLIYRVITKKAVIQVILTIIIFIIISIIGEIITLLIYMPFFNVYQLNNNVYIQLLSDITWAISILILFRYARLKMILTPFIEKVNNKSNTSNIVFSLLTIMMILFILTEINSIYGLNIQTAFLLTIVFIFLILFAFYLNEKRAFEKLSNEYDTLFQYIETFEDWIETEQLNRHEHKNQLAVLKLLAKEKKVKNKIDEIIKDYINIDNDTIHQLSTVPNGGLKGILYYKITVAKNNKINLTVDANLEADSIIHDMPEENIKTLSKLIGIYFDNAIEATINTKKKNILLEIYEYNQSLNIILSNTCNPEADYTNKNKKGFSTKGKNRGNGLYFAQKLIDKNSWLEERQDIIGEYYIQRLRITK